MMRPLMLASVILFAQGAAVAQTKNPGARCTELGPEVLSLISQYKELREKRSRLPQGEFDEELQSSGGRLSKVLNALGKELGRAPHTRQTIVECVGQPDAVRTHAKMRPLLGVYERELEKDGRKVVEKSSREYLIYFWRGWHDFLFFIIEDERVVDHGWWFAYE